MYGKKMMFANMPGGQKMGTLAIDAMGADLGPAEVVEGVRLALNEFDDLGKLILVGDQNILKPILKKKKIRSHPQVGIRHASQVVEMDDKPIESLKQKKDSSMARAVDLVKEKKAEAILSCGNTGSLIATGTVKLRPLEGLERSALATVIPTMEDNFILVDVGANPDTTSKQLAHNAILGYNYGKVMLKKDHPSVGLLTIGTEEGKGNELVNETHEMLKRIEDRINYAGLIEGFHLFEQHVDVVVCDGFVGNVLLKTCESLFRHIKNGIKSELTQKTLIRKIGAFLSIGAFKDIKKQLNPEQYGGAPLLGLNGIVVKTHGSSNCNYIMNAIHMCFQFINYDINKQVLADVLRANELISEATLAQR